MRPPPTFTILRISRTKAQHTNPRPQRPQLTWCSLQNRHSDCCLGLQEYASCYYAVLPLRMRASPWVAPDRWKAQQTVVARREKARSDVDFQPRLSGVGLGFDKSFCVDAYALCCGRGTMNIRLYMYCGGGQKRPPPHMHDKYIFSRAWSIQQKTEISDAGILDRM